MEGGLCNKIIGIENVIPGNVYVYDVFSALLPTKTSQLKFTKCLCQIHNQKDIQLYHTI